MQTYWLLGENEKPVAQKHYIEPFNENFSVTSGKMRAPIQNGKGPTIVSVDSLLNEMDRFI